jgi:uncharacterized protein
MSEPPADRLRVVDALRGLALGGIAVAHFGEQYLGYMPPPEHRTYAIHGTLDGVLEALSWIFIRGKGFGLFSLLFGLSFALQMQSAERRDPERDFRPRFAWRLAILFAIGWLHGLLYNGDILTVYALLGLPLMLFYRVPDRWLLALAAVLMVGTPRVVQRVVAGPVPAAGRAAEEARMNASAERHWQALSSGDVAAMARIHTTDGFRGRWDFQFGPMGRGFQTFALFLLGLWAGRHGVFHDPEAHRRLWRRLLIASGTLTLAVPLLAMAVFAAVQAAGGAGGGQPSAAGTEVMPDLTAWPFVAFLCAFDTWNGAMTLLYAAAFVRLCGRARWRPRLLRFEAVGRMALSSYVAQTVLGSLVFFGFGLGMLGRYGNAVNLPLGAAVFAIQVGVCAWWLDRFRFGPLEWVWRSLTWWRLQPFRQRSSPGLAA